LLFALFAFLPLAISSGDQASQRLKEGRAEIREALEAELLSKQRSLKWLLSSLRLNVEALAQLKELDGLLQAIDEEDEDMRVSMLRRLKKVLKREAAHRGDYLAFQLREQAELILEYVVEEQSLKLPKLPKLPTLKSPEAYWSREGIWLHYPIKGILSLSVCLKSTPLFELLSLEKDGLWIGKLALREGPSGIKAEISEELSGFERQGGQLFAWRRIKAFPWSKQPLLLFSSQPESKVLAPIYASLRRVALFSGVSLLITLLLAFLVARGITGPIQKGMVLADRLSLGEAVSEIETKQNDEIGALIHSMNMLAESLQFKTQFARSIADGELCADTRNFHQADELGVALRDMLGSLGETIGTVNRTSQLMEEEMERLSETGSILVEGNHQQAAASTEITSMVESVSKNLEQAAQWSVETHSKVERLKELSKSGQEALKRSDESMRKIQSADEALLSVVSTIESIANQTRLLALNATIEAARAGAHGRGFQVVATEVKSLADKANEAASEAEQMISLSHERVRSGSKIASEALLSFAEINEGVEMLAGGLGGLRDQTQEQAEHLRSIFEALVQIDDTIHNNSAQAEQVLGVVQSFGEQVSSLAELLGRFKL